MKAQECEIVQSVYPTYGFNEFGKITEIAMSIGKSPNYKFEIILIDFPQIRNRTIAYVIGIDTAERSHLRTITIDSICYRKSFDTCLVNIDSFAFKKDSIREFYIGQCKNGGLFHAGKAILMYNYTTQKYIYFYSTDGRMLEALNECKEYKYLKYGYELIKRTFVNLNLFRMQSFFPS